MIFSKQRLITSLKNLRDKTADLDDRYIEKEFQMNCRLNNFSPVLLSDVEETVSSGPAKSCELDPIPMSLVKKHIGVLPPIICDITNSSFEVLTLELSWMILKKPWYALFINTLVWNLSLKTSDLYQTYPT